MRLRERITSYAAINRCSECLGRALRSPGRISCVPPEESQLCHPDTAEYNQALGPQDREICNLLAGEIDQALPEAENKIWHAHPVWFLDGNPVVGYSKLKQCVRLLFWSGQSFEEEGLKKEGSYKAAEARYTAAGQVNRAESPAAGWPKLETSSRTTRTSSVARAGWSG